MTSDDPSHPAVFIHPQALCETNQIGRGTRVWAFAHILPGAVIGGECNICDGVFVESDVRVGSRVTVKCGVQLWDGVTLEDDVFVGPNATFTNDRFPRSRDHSGECERTLVCRGASVGANATVLPGVVIGAHAMVGAGAVVTRSVPPHAIVMGNPARITGYAGSAGVVPAERRGLDQGDGPVMESRVQGVTLHRLTHARDLRGDIAVGEFERDIPFSVKRFFVAYSVPSQRTRGEHAHYTCHQFVVCVRGRCALVVDDGEQRQEFTLDSPTTGVYIPPMTWGIQYKYSEDGVLLVFASEHYDPADYIRDYSDFLRIQAGRRK